VSFGIPVGDVPSMVDHPRLVTAVARSLYVEGVDTAAHERYIHAPLVPRRPAPYRRAVGGKRAKWPERRRLGRHKTPSKGALRASR